MIQTLWIMRHGLAVDQYESDFSRQLSATGKLQAENVARQLLTDQIELPQRMLVSPFKRTQQTANIVHRTLGLQMPFESEDLLVHSADFKILGNYLLALEDERVLVVSHMPIVAQLCEYLSPGCGIYGFQTAQLVELKMSATAKWVLSKSYLAQN